MENKTYSAEIRYLGTKATVVVAVPVDGLQVGWGDRRDGLLSVWTPQYEVYEGRLRKRNSDGNLYDCNNEPEVLKQLLECQRIVSAAADLAEKENPDIAAAVASYAAIRENIKVAIQRCRVQRTMDEQRIAKAFGHTTVRVGEQVVPGKNCVRNIQGTILGYADCRDGQWLGTIERT